MISSDINEAAEPNIPVKEVTLEVSNELKSMDIALQLPNIFSILTTLEVSKCLKSKILKQELSNIEAIFVAIGV